MNLLERLREAGFPVTLIPGKKGGYWTAKIKLQD
jgi:DNA-binding IscR family transcriptional regulator